VKTVVAEAVERWGEAASALTSLSNRDGTVLPLLWSLVSSVVARRQAPFADFPSLTRKTSGTSSTVDAYGGLERIIARIEAARTSAPAPGVDAAVDVEQGRQLKISLSALLRLESVFREYMSGLVGAHGDLHNWPMTPGTPVWSLLAAEKDWWSD